MKTEYKGFTLVEITLVMVLISILLVITTPLVSNIVARNDVGSAHELLYNSLLRAQQLSKNQYQDSQWRVCLDNSNKQYTITSGTCSDTTNAEIIKIASNITISSEQTLDILFKAISGELDNTSNSITITLTGGGVSKSIKINTSGVIDKEANTTSASTTTTPSIVTDGLVLNLDAGNINSYPGLSGNGNTWFDLSGNNNNGTLINGVGYNSTNGGSLVFDGVNDYVTINDTNSLDLTELTISLWFNRGDILALAPGDQQNLFVKGNTNAAADGDNVNYAIKLLGPTGGGQYQWTNPSSGGGVFSPPAQVLFANQWYNLVIIHVSTNTPVAYLNGVEQTNWTMTGGSASNPLVANSWRATIIGDGERLSGQLNASFNGRMSLVKVYNRALTQQEVQQNFNATKGRFGL